MRNLKFTPLAEQRLLDILSWTFENFGPGQASAYESQLIERCKGIAAGTVATQSCQLLTMRSIDLPLRFGRAGKHIVIFLLTDTDCVIVEVLHSSSDLAARVEALAGEVSEGPKTP